MPANKSRKYQTIIHYIEDTVGADVNRDLLKVALESDDLSGELDVDISSQTLPQIKSNLEQISGQAQSAVDVADQIDKIQNILSGQVVTVTDDGSLNIAGVVSVQEDSPLDVSASEVDVDIATQSLSPLTVTDDGSLNVAGTTTVTDNGSFNVAGTVDVQESSALDVSANTVPTEHQTPVGVEDSTGTQIDPSRATDHPNQQQQQDLIATGALTIGPVAIDKSQAVLIAANSDDNNNWKADVEWQDDSGNVTQTESASDIALNGVDNDFSRLVRKGSQVKVTFTDTSGGSNNNINAFVGTHE